MLVTNFGGGPSIPKFCVATSAGVVFEDQVKITIEHRRGASQIAHLRAPKSMKYAQFREIALTEVGLAELAEDYTLISSSSGQQQCMDAAAKEAEEPTLDSLGVVVCDTEQFKQLVSVYAVSHSVGTCVHLAITRCRSLPVASRAPH